MNIKKNNWWNIPLWIAQILLSVTFLWAGTMKIFNPAALPWPWIKAHPSLVNVTAAFDLLVGFGLVLPTIFRIQPQITVYAAYGAIALMTGAVIFHASRGEVSVIGFNIFVALSALFIAWGRQNKAKIIDA